MVLTKPCSENNMRRTILLLILMLIGKPSLAYTEQPINVLRKNAAETIRILKDPQYQDDTRREMQQLKLREIARRVFDFEEFSMRALGSNWRRFTIQERRTFTDVFSEFLSRHYLSKLQEKYNGEKVIFLNQELISDTRALVHVKILWKGMEIPVSIWMLKRSGAWKAYDISAHGVGAVQNYRVQFRALLIHRSPNQIIELIKSRI